MRGLFGLLLPAFLFAEAHAGPWQAATNAEDGTAIAYTRAQALNDMSLFCTRPNYQPAAWGRKYQDNHPPQPTAPGTYRVELNPQPFPRANAKASQDGRVSGWVSEIEIDDRWYSIPDMQFNLVTSMFEGVIRMDDPLIPALKSGNRATVTLRGDLSTLEIPLRGSSRSLSALETFCTAPAATTTTTAAATGSGQVVRARKGDLARFRRDYGENVTGGDWFENGNEALAYIYSQFPGGNAIGLDVAYYKRSGGTWRNVGKVEKIFGLQPRDVRFTARGIEVTTTTLRPGEPRCCPTGTGRWRIDRKTLRARKR